MFPEPWIEKSYQVGIANVQIPFIGADFFHHYGLW